MTARCFEIHHRQRLVDNFDSSVTAARNFITRTPQCARIQQIFNYPH